MCPAGAKGELRLSKGRLTVPCERQRCAQGRSAGAQGLSTVPNVCPGSTHGACSATCQSESELLECKCGLTAPRERSKCSQGRSSGPGARGCAQGVPRERSGRTLHHTQRARSATCQSKQGRCECKAGLAVPVGRPGCAQGRSVGALGRNSGTCQSKWGVLECKAGLAVPCGRPRCAQGRSVGAQGLSTMAKVCPGSAQGARSATRQPGWGLLECKAGLTVSAGRPRYAKGCSEALSGCRGVINSA